MVAYLFATSVNCTQLLNFEISVGQVWGKGSGCVASVAYGLWGSATLLFGMSVKARESGIFQKFWDVSMY